MGACLGGQNSAPCVKLSPLFKKKKKNENVKPMRRMRHRRTPRAPAAPPHGLRGSLRQSWQSPPAGLFHLLPYPTATGGPSSPQKQGAAQALWVLPCQLANSSQPSSRHLRDQRATLPLQPLTRPWAQTHLLDLSGLYQAVATRKRGSASPGESLGRWMPFPSESRKRLVPACLHPACEPVCPFGSHPLQTAPGPHSPLPPLCLGQ